MGLRILHLSDIHLGIDLEGKSRHRYHIGSTEKPDPSQIAKLLRDKYQANDIDLIIDSGDLAWLGNTTDYSFSKKFYEEIQNHFTGVPIVLIPGNHDVNWTASTIEEQQNDYLKFTKDFYQSDFEDLYPLFKSLGTRQRIVQYRKLDDKKLIIVGLNSAANLDADKNMIFVEKEILEELEKKIEADNAKDYLKILVIHHHLFPFIEPDFKKTTDAKSTNETIDQTLVVNSASIQSWLADNKFSIVLHGHRHLFHGRVDTLWHSEMNNETGNRLIVIGGGSVGINRDERGELVPLSYNILEVHKVHEKNYKVKVSVFEITRRGGGILTPKENILLQRTVYTEDKTAANYFEAEDMKDCHEQIFETLKDKTDTTHICNFMSVIHKCDKDDFRLPNLTCEIKGRAATEEDIINSFLSLHPEYDITDEWSNPEKIIKALRQHKNNYSINHGLRMFAANELHNLKPNDKIRKEDFPIIKAIKKIEGAHEESKGYIGLYDYEIDIKSQSSVLPGMMGIQLVPDNTNKVINLVATFRTIELSFWWVVNMYEALKILDFACKESKESYKAGSITFFAAIARWKKPDEVSAAIKPEIENKQVQELYALVSLIEQNNEESISQFKELLIDFRDNLSDINISFNKLEMLFCMIEGIKDSSELATTIKPPLKLIITYLENCLLSKNDPINMKSNIKAARNKLSFVIDKLK